VVCNFGTLYVFQPFFGNRIMLTHSANGDTSKSDVTGTVSALGIRPDSLAEKAFTVEQLCQTGADVHLIEVHVRELHAHSTALLATAQVREWNNRQRVHQTTAGDDAVVTAINKLHNRFDHPILVDFAPEKETPPEDLPDFDNEGFWESQRKFAKRTKYAVSTLRKHREAKEEPTWYSGTIGKTSVGHYIKKIRDGQKPLYEYFVYNNPEKNHRFNNPRPKNKR
jgi:hypothetical protein